MPTTRVIGTGLTIFTVGGTATNLAGDTDDCRFAMTTDTVEGAGATDTWHWPVGVGLSMELEGNFSITGTAWLLGTAALGAAVAFGATTLANTYSGTGIITRAEHRVAAFSKQTMSVTIQSRGTVGINA